MNKAQQGHGAHKGEGHSIQGPCAPSEHLVVDNRPLKPSVTSLNKPTLALADLRGRQGCMPPWGPNSFKFMQFMGKKWPNNSFFWELAPPPRENPGSATDLY